MNCYSCVDVNVIVSGKKKFSGSYSIIPHVGECIIDGNKIYEVLKIEHDWTSEAEINLYCKEVEQ